MKYLFFAFFTTALVASLSICSCQKSIVGKRDIIIEKDTVYIIDSTAFQEGVTMYRASPVDSVGSIWNIPYVSVYGSEPLMSAVRSQVFTDAKPGAPRKMLYLVPVPFLNGRSEYPLSELVTFLNKNGYDTASAGYCWGMVREHIAQLRALGHSFVFSAKGLKTKTPRPGDGSTEMSVFRLTVIASTQTYSVSNALYAGDPPVTAGNEVLCFKK